MTMLETQVTRAIEAWERGLVVPGRITMALDLCGLDGPEVDARCGVSEPAVDEWEAGLLYPTWDQLVRLAALTDFPEAFFTRELEHDLTPLDTSMRFHVTEAVLLEWLAEPLALHAFPPHVVAECEGTRPDVAEIERRAGYRIPAPVKQLELPI